MLSRPATKLSLLPDDIAAYEQRKAQREAMKQDQELGGDMYGIDEAYMQQSKAKAKTKEQRIGICRSTK
ncbi:hypothetical protein AC579_2365 [Pseudocercospora musae]|uniref:Anaphase-promoting complex subunit CDC26 n=1 Tax=Pseudocercospora musae TaxID=113226 RepID=A0A139I799_9PEZI|nr:hypothetical protein AC579_2365 [Pseudocercospora musae]